MSKLFLKKAENFFSILYNSRDKKVIEKKLKKRFKKEDFEQIIQFLQENNFIKVKKIKETHDQINLTRSGIEYFQKQETINSQKEFNKIIAFTASILALIGIYDFFTKLEIISKANWITWIFVIFAVIAIGPIVAFIINSYLK